MCTVRNALSFGPWITLEEKSADAAKQAANSGRAFGSALEFEGGNFFRTTLHGRRAHAAHSLLPLA